MFCIHYNSGNKVDFQILKHKNLTKKVLKWSAGLEFASYLLTVENASYSTANKYSSAGYHEQKNKKATSQIKFSAVTIKQQIKQVLQHSLCK